ncbi:hypothetical protein QQ045_028985 [Rhodiola kirilowii]
MSVRFLNYNKPQFILDILIQVFPGAWTAIMVSLDNDGIWNLRAQNLDSWYLGQELYLSVANPKIKESNDVVMPENVIYCGVLSSLQNDRSQRVKFSSSTNSLTTSKTFLVIALVAWFFALIR